MPNVFPSIKAPLNEESQFSVLSKPLNYGTRPLPPAIPGVGAPPPAPMGRGVGAGAGVGNVGGGGIRGGFDNHFNMMWDPHANGLDQGGYVPLHTRGYVPGDENTDHTMNANPNMGMLDPNQFAAAGGIGASFAQREANAAPGAFAPPPSPLMRGFATGGRTDPGETALVGENGPELIKGQPDGSVAVLPRAQGSAEDPDYGPYKGGPSLSGQFSPSDDSHLDWIRSDDSASRYSPPPPAPDTRTFADKGNVSTLYSRTNSPTYAKALDDLAAAKASGAPALGSDETNGDSDSHIGAMTDSAPNPPAAPVPFSPVSQAMGQGMSDAFFGPPAGSGASPQTYQAPPTSFEGAQGKAVNAAEKFRADAMSELRNPTPPGGAANPNMPPPAPEMNEHNPRPGEKGFTPSPVLNRWNEGASPLREQMAMRAYNRSHPTAALQRDTAIDANVQKMNRDAEKFNIEQQQKHLETLRKTAHNIGQEQHMDDTITGKNAVETAKLQETARKEQNKRKSEAMDLSDALGNVETRLKSLTKSDPFYQAKAALLDHIMSQQTAKGVAAGVKYFDESYPHEIDMGGTKAVMAPAGTFHQLPAPKDDAARQHQQTIQHFQTAFPNFNNTNDAPIINGKPDASNTSELGPIRKMMLEDYNNARAAMKGSAPASDQTVAPVTGTSAAIQAAKAKLK